MSETTKIVLGDNKTVIVIAAPDQVLGIDPLAPGQVSITSELPEVDPPPPPPPDPDPDPVGDNWVPNWLLQQDLYTPDPGDWQFLNGYFYDTAIHPTTGGMHGPLVKEFKPKIVYESPTGTWYWQADRDHDGSPPDTWPAGDVYDMAYLDFAAGDYEVGDTLLFQWEEGGHIREQPGHEEDGSVKTTLIGYDGDTPNILVELEGQQSARGAGHRSPPETINTVITPDKKFSSFRIVIEATLRGSNAGLLWGAFRLGKA